MKKKTYLLSTGKSIIIACFGMMTCFTVQSQNTFPSTGRAGIYTTSPAASLQVKGGAQIGTTANYVNIDSASGKLTFGGTGVYQVGGNKYVFQYTNSPNYGLFFNSSNVQYEFRNGSAVPVFTVAAATGNSIFNGTLKVGAYTLPATDGANGQVLKTNGAGALTWKADSVTVYKAGTGISISGTTITNSAPDKTVALTAGTGISVTGTYPNFTIASTGGYANQALSNLAATSINQSLVPNSNGAFRLGQRTLRWDSAYLNGLVFGNGSIQTVAFIPYSAGTGLSLSGTTFTNTAPDKIVTLTGSGGTTVSGTYPNFTISSSSGSYYLTTGTSNTAVGYQSLYSNTSGTTNTAVGVSSLFSNLNGYSNTATGHQALFSNESGNYNTAYGESPLYLNQSGNYNAAFGSSSLFNNSSGSYNAAFGSTSLFNNSSGSYNTASGYKALFSNTSGYSNVAIGVGTMYNSTNAHNFVAVGDSALYNQAAISDAGEFPSPGYNTALGSKTLFSNNTGQYNSATAFQSLYFNTSGSYNTANGAYSLYGNTSGSTGSANTASGYQSLDAISSGNNNTGTGYQALFSNASGYNNTSIGFQALYTNNTGFNNTAIGVNADVSSNGYNNSTAVGVDATITASNQVRIGSIGSIYGTDPTSIGGKVNFTALSDGRVKKNIKENVPGLAFINKLKPITYNIDNDAINKIVQRPEIKDKDGKTIQPSTDEITARKAEEQIVHTGFIAQDVEKAAKSLNYDFSGIDAAKNDKNLYGLRYAEFVVPLVKAVQELSAINNDKQQQIDSLKQNTVSLQSQINELKEMVQALANKGGITLPSQSVKLSSASLEQNTPNPYNQSTSIRYSLPATFGSAQIIVTDISGTLLKQIPIMTKGEGIVNINASTLSAGTYNYTLIVDGSVVDTKKMVLVK